MTSASARQQRLGGALKADMVRIGGLDLEALRRLRGDASDAATIAWAKSQALKLLSVDVKGAPRWARFQFDDGGQLLADVASHVETLQAAGLGPWQTWTWMTEPTGMLSGGVPHEMAATDRGRTARAVERLAERVRGGGVAEGEDPNASLNDTIAEAVSRANFGAALAARGITTVALDADGELTEYLPDGTSRPVPEG